MPYLQLDVGGRHASDVKRRTAQRMAETYASLMSVDLRRVTVAIRECGDGALWRVVDGEPIEVALLMCDIRRGRPAALRLELAHRLIADCVAGLGLRDDRINVEFTQHSGDEMVHPTLGGFSPDWSADEG